MNIDSCTFRGTSVADVVANPTPFIEAYKDHGLVVFKEVGLEEADVTKIVTALSPHLGWVFTVHHKPDHMAWGYTQNHDGRIRDVISNNNNRNDFLLIEWHLEGVSLPHPQRAAAWNMWNFKCPPGSGSTGFVDMCELWDDIPADYKNLLQEAEIIHFYNISRAPTDEEDLSFREAVSRRPKRIWGPDQGDGTFLAAYPRRAVEDHPVTGNKVVRMCPCRNQFGFQDHLFRVRGKPPTTQQKELFEEALEWVRFNVVDVEERQSWHFWDQGDLLVTDLFRMAHGVRAGFLPGQRTFTGNWLFPPGVPENPAMPVTVIPADELL